METRQIDLDGHTYEIAVIRDGDTEFAIITRDGAEIRRMNFRPDQDIRINLLDILESDIRNGITR